MDLLLDPQAWIAFFTLTALELVLGIDNIVFISILVSKLPAEEQKSARLTGLGLAMGMRILLLLALSWIIGLTRPVFSAFGHPFSGRDLVLLVGGLFLVAKATHEIHDKLEGEEGRKDAKVRASFGAIMVQIALLDIVFSLDSVITAVGMVPQISIMIAAVVAAVIFMMGFSSPVSDFVERHPTVKMLALSFLLLVGVTLIVEGMGGHVAKGTIYFSMAFSLFVEMLNLRLRRKAPPVHLHAPYTTPAS